MRRQLKRQDETIRKRKDEMRQDIMRSKEKR